MAGATTERSGGLPRVILHLDMDAFYAAVEVRENPALRGKPVIVGHPGRRGVVSTCSYEARRFGVHSAMPSVTAARLCPDALWVSGRMSLYVEVSRRIRRLMDDVSPVVEPLSIDEAFIDLTGIAGSLDEAKAIARNLKDRIRETEQLSASVGIAPNKFLAKVASDMDKPDGLTVLPLEDVPARLWPLPVRRLWGVGPRTAERLATLGINTIGDLAAHSTCELAERVGENQALRLQHLARGEDERRVSTGHERKSISEERTYARDMTAASAIDRALLARAEGVARDLRRKKLQARTVHLKVRTGDFTTWTRSHTLPAPTDLTEVIVGAARELMARNGSVSVGAACGFWEVGVSGLSALPAQERLLIDDDEARARHLARATDAIRRRFGEGAVTRARLQDGTGGDGDEPPEASSLPAVD